MFGIILKIHNRWTPDINSLFKVGGKVAPLHSLHKRTKQDLSTSKMCHFKTIHFEITKEFNDKSGRAYWGWGVKIPENVLT